MGWWFVDAPQWAWREVARGGHSFAGVAVFAVAALVYAAVNVALVGGLIAGLAALFRRGRQAVSGR